MERLSSCSSASPQIYYTFSVSANLQLSSMMAVALSGYIRNGVFQYNAFLVLIDAQALKQTFWWLESL